MAMKLIELKKSHIYYNLYRPKKKLSVSTNLTNPIFSAILNFCWCLLTILEQKYDCRYEEGMFHALTYFF